jgi:ribonucleoside-diphosphate reductase alpha chain
MSNNMDVFQEFIVTSRYCKWVEEKGRRETWNECVDRYYDYIIDTNAWDWGIEAFSEMANEIEDCREATKNLEVFPSMRALMSAGIASDVDNTVFYNCSYLPIKDVQSFAEVLYILCCGTGVGFSCEREYTDQLPVVPEEITKTENVIMVQDSRAGWADALKELMNNLYEGNHPTWDTSLIRPAGARLKTFGGRASGPEPLERLFRYIVKLFYNASGRKLRSIEVHDIVCLIGEIVIAGAVRRSALISLSDVSDHEMAKAKSGPWWDLAGHRSLANNSAVYKNKPTLGQYLEEWSHLYESRSGERGICNRKAMAAIAEKCGRKTEGVEFGTNPCSEIILRPYQFCNLTEVVVRPEDDLESLREKVIKATITGTIQSSFTYFPYLRKEFKENCEEERLLGVSFTGIYDSKLMSGQLGKGKLSYVLEELREEAVKTNLRWARKMNIAPSKAITCCKPSGTTSCVANTSSGLHPRYSDYYIRRVRADLQDPLCKFMKDSGIPFEPCVLRPDTTAVFSFPMKAPCNTVTQQNIKALDHLDLWLIYQKYWCQHKPSVTVSYHDDEFLSIGQWVWDNWEYVSGISFLPADDHVYDQAPFEVCDARTFNLMNGEMPNHIDWSNLSNYEKEDTTTNSHTLACQGGSCEVVDLMK